MFEGSTSQPASSHTVFHNILMSSDFLLWFISRCISNCLEGVYIVVGVSDGCLVSDAERREEASIFDDLGESIYDDRG